MKQFLLLESALAAATEIAETINALPQVLHAEIAGSIRRNKDIVGDIDIVVAASNLEEAADAVAHVSLLRNPRIDDSGSVLAMTWHGMTVKVILVSSDRFGSTLQNQTGSVLHNKRVEERARICGLDVGPDGIAITADNENSIYAALGMTTPPPQLREDRGEIEAALDSTLPVLVRIEDVRGELHSHTVYSDGVSSVDQMAEAAIDRGYEYWAVTDHSRRPGLMHLSADDFAGQAKDVRAANDRFGGRITVLHGIEVNIGPDGSLDYPDELLSSLDVVVASIHDRWGGGADPTNRLLRAIENPRVNVIGHPTSRFIGRLPAAEFDLDAVFSAAAQHRVALEINAHPERLDLCGEHVMLARSLGCSITINCDAHGRSDLERMPLGIATAQRGWATADDVINTWPLDKLRSFLRKEALERTHRGEP